MVLTLILSFGLWNLIYSSAVCPTGFSTDIHRNGLCYQYHTTNDYTWDEARSFCTWHSGATLAKITHSDVWQLIKESVAVHDYDLWIGASDRSDEGRFQWLDGTSCCNSAFWATGEPNHSGDEDCVNIWKTGSKLGLNDEDCDANKGAICMMSECKTYDHCANHSCSRRENTICDKCEGDNVYFKRTHSDTMCERMCARSNHLCWPGKCDNDLVKNCYCSAGFHNVSKGTTETSCQLNSNNKASIETCAMALYNSNGKGGFSKSNSTSTACDFLQDFYGNFQPSTLKYDFVSSFRIDASGWGTKPGYIKESHFGVTDAKLVVAKRSVTGSDVQVAEHHVLNDTNQSLAAKELFTTKANLSIASGSYALRDGERLCVQFKVQSGGYVVSQNEYSINDPPRPYEKTRTTRELCYRFDSSSPVHCQETDECSFEPLEVRDRITRNPVIPVKFRGWQDPIPENGNQEHASGIESYTITVNAVVPPNGTLGSSIYSTKVNASVSNVYLNLTSDTPKLYCISIETKDVADNIKQARRFVLYDNTSFVESLEEDLFFITSASKQTNHDWQTHHNDICIEWEGYFYNKFYMHNKLLNPVTPAPLIPTDSVYEQNKGLLQVSGTTNVDGIIQFNLNWLRFDRFGLKGSDEQVVQNFTRQRTCKSLNMSDGDTFVFHVNAIDIVNNSLVRNRTVFIDRTVPNVNNIYLVKNGQHMLFVHDSTELSTMLLYFEAFDIHSGVQNVMWKLETSDRSLTLGDGAIGAVTLDSDCGNESTTCYCPSIGKCEHFNYTVSLNKLQALGTNNGNHNRNYVFTLHVTNHAMLTSIEYLDILVDDSPPEKGVVFEGASGANEVDYTSDTEFFVNWHGFIDHESGIKKYIVAIAERCLNAEELMLDKDISTNISFVQKEEVLYTETMTKFYVNETGTFYTSVIAFNNALNPSQVSCSDGITRDTSKPVIFNVTIQNARASESIYCLNDRPYLIRSDLMVINLNSSSKSCKNVCKSVTTDVDDFLTALPNIKLEEDATTSDFLCSNLQKHSTTDYIFVPHDNFALSFECKEDISQIDDFYVGMSTSRGKQAMPDLVDFRSTNRRKKFIYRHAAIGSDEPFFIVIKAVNKASVAAYVTFGPMIIDETPPYATDKPSVTVKGDFIFVEWANSTFVDDEQKSPVDQIFIQFGHSNKKDTPLLEWNMFHSIPCFGNVFCFKYPLRRLQHIDAHFNYGFTATMIIYNKAGHFTEHETDTFHIPSKYPPGAGTVKDIDPSFLYVANQEVDIHFTPHTVCAVWYGFQHHVNLTFEIGVGINASVPDKVPFRKSDTNVTSCISSPDLKLDTLYFFIVKATCQAGSTISSSNGVRIIPEKPAILEDVTILSQPRSSPRFSISETSSSVSVCIISAINVGARYDLHFTAAENVSASLNVNISDGFITRKTKSENTITLSFISFLQKPCFQFLNVTISKIQLEEIGQNFTKVNDSIYLAIDDRDDIPYSVYYEVAVMQVCENRTLSCNEIIRPFQRTNLKNVTKIENVPLVSGDKYRLCLRICSTMQCSKSILTDYFEIDVHPPFGVIHRASIEQSDKQGSYFLSAEWESFVSASGVSVYKWTIFEDSSSAQLTKWISFFPPNTSRIEVKEVVDIPVHIHTTIRFCIQAFSYVGRHSTTCKRLSSSGFGGMQNSVVYEFDRNNQNWSLIQQLMHSSDLGDMYSFIHDNEVNFGTANTDIVGVVINSEHRNFTWYLMTVRHVPTECHFSRNCVYGTINNDNVFYIDKEFLQPNTLYYTCVRSSRTEIKREFSTEILKKLEACSNGFIIDDVPPSHGIVSVETINGYVNNNDLHVSWTGFTDEVKTFQLGYPSDIKEYTVDIVSQSQNDGSIITAFVGLNEHGQFPLHADSIKDGYSFFVTVTAHDYAGFKTKSVSDEVVIDRSPPSIGKLILNNQLLNNKILIATFDIHVELVDFTDYESGIDGFEVYISTKPDTVDISSMRRFHENTFDISLRSSRYLEGVEYYIHAQAINRAGLSSAFSTVKFQVDRTPPEGGHVWDGMTDVDADFQKDFDQIQCQWKDFFDHHSDIMHYMVSLGSSRYDHDVAASVNVGLQTSHIWYLRLATGRKYYCNVMACNRAGLCSSRSSNGIILDKSPPIPGKVRVGSRDLHLHYLSQRSHVEIHWVGFEDPESGIERFEVCIGTSEGVCDILPSFNSLLKTSFIRTNINLPIQTKLYVMVWAFNYVGQNVSQISPFIYIDDTPPQVVLKPKFNLNFGRSSVNSSFDYQWDRSIVDIFWEFTDAESHVVDQTLSLKTHHDGHTPLENIQIGAVNSFSITLDKNNWLNNGDKYYMFVSACNAAGLCTTSQTNELLIDASPPHTGGFMQPMSWKNYITANKTMVNVTLSWYGFTDEESEIKMYYITVSRSYSGEDMSEGKLNVIPTDDGKEITASFTLNNEIITNEKIVLTILAENYAGLNSTAAKVTVVAVQTGKFKYLSEAQGYFEIEKHSCDVHYCDGSCTCAVFGRPCLSDEIPECSSKADIKTNVNISTGLVNGNRFFTKSSACIYGNWNITHENTPIERSQWTVGIFNGSEPGDGVFDLSSESPWIDVDKENKGIYCLPVGKGLNTMYAYSLYLKIWLNPTTFETYSSKPLVVDHTPPSIRRGRYIKDSNIFCQLDFDVIDWTENITACWDGVFSEQQSTITYYNVSLGTSVKGNDIVEVSNVGLSTNFTVTRVRLEPGIKYFFTVTAVNILGLNSQKSSDGFLIDTDNPIHGVVYNTGRFMDSSFQGEADSLNISWTGFVDHYSGIQSYYIALAEVNETLNQGDFVNVGLQTTYSFRNLILRHGYTYISYVKAVDSVKHYSNVSSSPAITIDTTPPAGFYCRNFNAIKRDTFMVERVRLIEFPYSFRKDGLYRAIGYLESGVNDFRVTIQSGYLHIALPIVTNHKGSIHFEYDFSPSESLNETLYINIFGKNATVYMTLFECDAKVQSNENVVRVSQLVGSELAVSVNVEDKESKIKQVLLGVGTYPNSFQIVPHHQVHCVNIHLLNIDGVSHGTPLFVTAIVDNHAGLRSTFSSIPIVVDRTGPVISLLEFNTISFLDTAANGTVETTVNISWSAMDNESGLKSCYVGIGNTVNDNNVLKATYAPGTMFTAIMLNLPHGTRMIANIRCINKVEMASAMSSSTHYVLFSKPDMNSVYLNVIADNEMSTDCNMKHGFSEGPVSIAPTASPSCLLYLQTNDSSIKLEWSGRTDKLYIERFEFKVAKNENETIIDWTSCGLHRMVDVAGLSLQSNQMYTCSVRGIDIIGGRSDPLTALVKSRWFVPSLTDKAITASFSNKTVSLNWTGVFAIKSNNPFLYDVSVGTRKGYNDVIDIKKTRYAFVTFRLPENSILGPVGNELFINVVCKDMLGLFTVYETTIAVL